MGFWRSFFGLEDNETSRREGKKSEFDTTFVTYDEEKNFEDSIYGSLQLFDADVSYISEVLPERGESLQKQIDLLTALLEKTNNEDDPEVISVFRTLKSQFEEDKKLADGEYTISELEHQNLIMDKTFENPLYSDGINKQKLEEYISFISKVQKKVAESEMNGSPLLTKVQKQKFNSISMKSEYRIKMLELMFLSNNYYDVPTNPFKDLSLTKQKIFSKLFFEDAKQAARQYERLSLSEEEFNKYDQRYFNSIDSMAKELNRQMANVRMIDDFSISQLFDSSNENSKSFEFLKKFVKFKTTLNEMEDKKDKIGEELKKREEQEREKAEKEKQKQEEKARKEKEKQDAIDAEAQKEREELEKLKAYTDADMRREIDRIEHDLTAKGSRFVNILEFQKKIARAKGLLETEENLTKDGIMYKAVDATTAYEIIKKANMLGISYAAFPDCQENRDGGFMFAVPESEKGIFNIEREAVPFSCRSYDWRNDENFGQYPGFILNELDRMLEENETIRNMISTPTNGTFYILNVGYNTYSGKTSGYNGRKNTICRTLDKIRMKLDSIGNNPEELQDVMCYISVPATRNIIPILEAFKSAGVSSYIEPAPKSGKRNENNRNNIQIYFERDQLDKFKEDVFPQISNQNIGIVNLNWENGSMGAAIRDEINWPKLKDKDDDER